MFNRNPMDKQEELVIDEETFYDCTDADDTSHAPADTVEISRTAEEEIKILPQLEVSSSGRSKIGVTGCDDQNDEPTHAAAEDCSITKRLGSPTLKNPKNFDASGQKLIEHDLTQCEYGNTTSTTLNNEKYDPVTEFTTLTMIDKESANANVCSDGDAQGPQNVGGASESKVVPDATECGDQNGAEDQAADREKESSNESSDDDNTLTETEIEERGKEAKMLKEEGNLAYKNDNFADAERLYTEGIKICPKCLKKDRAILFSNRSACLVKTDKTEAAVEDCSKAIAIHPTYVKALLRRAQLYEKLEKFEEAMKDYDRLLQLDNSLHTARAALLRLPGEIEQRNERLKAQMMSSLKDLGNLFLRPFGLSTDNFQMQQDPNTGSYNMQFSNNPTENNGSTNGPSNNA